MESLRDSQAIDLAVNKFTTGASPILAGLNWLRSKGKGGLISAYIQRVTAPDKWDIRRDNSKYQVLYAVHEYSKKLGRAGDLVEPFDLLKSWGLSEIYPLYVSLYGEQNPATKGMIGDFLAKAKKWAADVKSLHDTPMATPQLKAKKETLLKRAKLLKNAIEAVFPDFKLDIGTLQAAPIVWLVTGGVLAGFLAAMAAWTAKSVALIVESNNLQKQFAQDPEKAIIYQQAQADREKAEAAGGLADIFAKATPLLLIGGIIYVIYQYGGKRRGN